VHVSDCDIQTGDDCLSLFGSEKVTVANCTLSSRSSAIRIGFTGGDIRDCEFANLVIFDSNRGLGVYVRGSGSIENVLFSDIVIRTRLFTGHWWGKGEPIHVSAVPWDTNSNRIGQIKNVRFRNIIAEGQNGIVVYGCPQSVVKDLVFEDVKLRINNSPLQESYGGNFDLRASRDVAKAVFAHDIAALYCRDVDGLEIRGLDIQWAEGLPRFFSHGIEIENFTNVDIDRFVGGPAHKDGGLAAIALSKGSGIAIRDCKAAKGTGVFVSLEGVSDCGLFVNNDLQDAQKISEPEKLPFQVSGNRPPKK
jgi:hypothetical protein